MEFKNQKLEDFEKNLKNQKVAVIGLGVSNIPLLDYLKQKQANVAVFDDRDEEKIDKTIIDKLKQYEFKYFLGKTNLENLIGFDLIFRSPSCMPTKPELVEEKERGAIVTTEIEQLMKMAPCKIIGITGSDGKTTTTSLTYEILANAGYTVHLGGNIGIPLFTKLNEIKHEHIIVLELSSFQLMEMELSPEIAAITNITPNHLNIHSSYEEYIEAKKNIFKYQDEKGIVVLNYDNEITRECKPEANGKVIYFSSKEKLDNGEKWVLRLKSTGDFNKKIVFKDLVKGTIELPENDIDQVLIKSDGIPPYAFAHVCDDHFMRVTTVTRDDSYISSVPYHLEIWNACGFKIPKFAHLLPLNKKEGETIRKISKRKDPEAAVSFYHEKGIPVEAVKTYFATIMNSNFEDWLLQNKTSSYRDFSFNFNKMSTSGSLFDLDKLINISKNYLSNLTAKEVFDGLDEWSKEFDTEFNEIINNHKEYTINILNIEREQKKPRKDYDCYSTIKNQIWYMYDELFNYNNYEFQTIEDKEEINKILTIYIDKYYNETDDKETWFNKIKELCDELGYASNMKEYKETPEKFKGNVADVSTVLRVALTTKSMTPDLYEIMKLLGKDRIKERYNTLIKNN